jgi:BASS family bile acid:Na+ symporter
MLSAWWLPDFLTTGMAPQQRSVVSLGLCTRNLGAALAPLVVEQAHPHTIMMIALGRERMRRTR